MGRKKEEEGMERVGREEGEGKLGRMECLRRQEGERGWHWGEQRGTRSIDKFRNGTLYF